MNVIYAQEPIRQSIFLAGPSPRDTNTPSWRPEALRILQHLNFKGDVYVPEPRTKLDDWAFNYDTQIKWEWMGIDTSAVVAFWIPRELSTMPGFTTNVEFGLTVASGKAVLGFPPDSPKNRYLDELAKRFNVPVKHTLTDTLACAMLKTWLPK